MKLSLPRNKVFAAIVIIFGLGIALSFLPIVIGLIILWIIHKKTPASRMKIAGMIAVAVITLFVGGAWIAGISSSKSDTSVQGAATAVTLTPTQTATPTLTPTPTITPSLTPTQTIKRIIPTATAEPTIQTIYTSPTATPTVTVQQQSTTDSTGLSNDNYYTNSNGNEVHSPAYSTNGSVPAGATAKCNDGTYSFSQSSRGTCSHHGGVAQWL